MSQQSMPRLFGGTPCPRPLARAFTSMLLDIPLSSLITLNHASSRCSLMLPSSLFLSWIDTSSHRQEVGHRSGLIVDGIDIPLGDLQAFPPSILWLRFLSNSAKAFETLWKHSMQGSQDGLPVSGVARRLFMSYRLNHAHQRLTSTLL